MRVRLSDIDPKVRRAAASRLARKESNPDVVLDLIAAALDPSDEWYVVGDDKRDMLPFVMSGHRDTLRAAPKYRG